MTRTMETIFEILRRTDGQEIHQRITKPIWSLDQKNFHNKVTNALGPCRQTKNKKRTMVVKLWTQSWIKSPQIHIILNASRNWTSNVWFSNRALQYHKTNSKLIHCKRPNRTHIIAKISKVWMRNNIHDMIEYPDIPTNTTRPDKQSYRSILLALMSNAIRESDLYLGQTNAKSKYQYINGWSHYENYIYIYIYLPSHE